MLLKCKTIAGVRSQESGVKPGCETRFINGLRQAALTIDVLTTLAVAILTHLLDEYVVILMSIK
ncbi:hypothetical protein VB711_23315 [Cronbergia sp. UHCC 0137]|uniref:hypothetical protein n=1 Tax=Cronbergia sp. UHCC 0137 TaxID=3110239 RepID=UPI002B1ECD4B|nr:hypothetical protein [Cronbergia sp. UHCC 0137]MEA5620747.1 hypothetical protein [Cronbergia sp. UHCC 0137]